MPIAPWPSMCPEEAEALRNWIVGGRAGSAAVRRARIVLLAADGLGPAAIAERLGCSKQTVITWRERYRTHGVEGLRDAPRSGRPPTVDEAAVVARTLEGPPGPGSGRWTTRRLAAELGISNAAVANVWRTRGILPGGLGGTRLATEPVLDEVLEMVVGLYLGSAERVLVLLVGAPGRPRAAEVVPARERPDVGARLLEGRPGVGAGDITLTDFLGSLVARQERLALLVEHGARPLREWVAGRPGVALHLVRPDSAWAGLASVACTVVGATMHGAASVARLAEVLDAAPRGGPICWTA
ncbi:MAG: helix-turn-helix domain-containing protein [Pseudonocardia sp.]